LYLNFRSSSQCDRNFLSLQPCCTCCEQQGEFHGLETNERRNFDIGHNEKQPEHLKIKVCTVILNARFTATNSDRIPFYDEANTLCDQTNLTNSNDKKGKKEEKNTMRSASTYSEHQQTFRILNGYIRVLRE